jgi:hypothetical protein
MRSLRLLGLCLLALVLPSTASADVTFRAAAAAGGGAVTSLAVNVPTGTAAGDVMLACIGARPDTITITLPSGWTLIRAVTQSAATANRMSTYYRVAGGAEPASYTWTFSATPTGVIGAIGSFVGVAPAAPPYNVETGVAHASTTAYLAPSVTPTIGPTFVVTCYEHASALTWTAISGTAAIQSAAGTNIDLLMSYRAIAARDAATGTFAATAGDADAGVVHTIALTPARAGGVKVLPSLR